MMQPVRIIIVLMYQVQNNSAISPAENTIGLISYVDSVKMVYSPPVYSYYVDCVRCSPGTNNWPKYLAASLLPTTAFFILILLLRFKATSPKYTGYLLYCQIATSPALLRFIIRFLPS